MTRNPRADFNAMNPTINSIVLIIIFFPLWILIVILTSAMSGQTKAIVCGVLLVFFILVPVFFLQQIRWSNEQDELRRAKIEAIRAANPPPPTMRTIYLPPVCTEYTFFVKPDLPFCRPGQDPLENRYEIEVK